MAAILTDAQLMAEVKAAGFTGNDAVIAFAIAKAESGGNSTVVSKPNNDGSVDRGLFQINSKAWAQFTNWSDPGQNASFAHDVVYKQQGWNAWTVYRSGSYRKYLSDGLKVVGTPAGNASAVSANPGATSAGITGGVTSNRFAGILSKELWKRIGIGAVGVLLLIVGFVVVRSEQLMPVIRKVAT